MNRDQYMPVDVPRDRYGEVYDWLKQPGGYMGYTCLLCNKQVDEGHIKSEQHRKRVDECLNCNIPVMPPHLATAAPQLALPAPPLQDGTSADDWPPHGQGWGSAQPQPHDQNRSWAQPGGPAQTSAASASTDHSLYMDSRRLSQPMTARTGEAVHANAAMPGSSCIAGPSTGASSSVAEAERESWTELQKNMQKLLPQSAAPPPPLHQTHQMQLQQVPLQSQQRLARQKAPPPPLLQVPPQPQRPPPRYDHQEQPQQPTPQQQPPQPQQQQPTHQPEQQQQQNQPLDERQQHLPPHMYLEEHTTSRPDDTSSVATSSSSATRTSESAAAGTRYRSASSGGAGCEASRS